MKDSSKKQVKNLFVETKKLNKVLTISLLSEILDRSTGEIEHFLYSKNRYPNDWDLWLLKEFCRYACLSIPIELLRYTSNKHHRVKRLAKKNRVTGRGCWVVVGERKQSQNNQYIYNGNLYTIPEIARMKRVQGALIYSILKSSEIAPEPETDITILVDNFLKHKDKKNKYIYHGQKANLEEIIKLSGLKRSTAYGRIKTANHIAGDDVTKTIDMKKHERINDGKK